MIGGMLNTALSLPDDPQLLQEMIAQLQAQLTAAEHAQTAQAAQLQEQHQRIDQLLEYIALLRRKRFGPSTDRIPEAQLKLFDEAELEALIGELESELAPPTPAPSSDTTKPAKPRDPTTPPPVRRPLPAHLPRVERIIDLPADAKAALGADWHLIGYDRSEQLAVIPRQTYVIVYLRAKYVARDATVPGAEVGVKMAPRAAQLIPKSMAHGSLLAAIVTAKFVDALPLYRQAQVFAREGLELSRQTLAGWLMQLEQPLQPVALALRETLRQGPVVHVDETPVQVLREPDREATQKSYMWVFCGGPPGSPVRWFEYAPSRAAAVPQRVLFGEPSTDPPRFYLQSDGYSAYHVIASAPEVIGHAGCWAHVRRKFVEAAAGRNASAAQQMVALIGELYTVERGLRDADPAIRQAVREERSRPVLARIKSWLDSASTRVLPKGLLGGAIAYAVGQWPILTTFLDEGHLELDNNRAENAVRPFVIGRKNWLFAGSPRGARVSALLYSLIETAKANGLEPWAYLNHLFEHLPLAKTPAAVAALLPFNLKLDDVQREGSIR